MSLAAWFLLLSALSGLFEGLFELQGRVFLPERFRRRPVTVYLYSVSTAYQARKQVFPQSRFKFSKLEPGLYTVAVTVRGNEEVRQTIDVGPSVADARGRVSVELHVESRPIGPGSSRGVTISVRQLSIPAKARDEYRAALDRLAKNDVPGAIQRLEKALSLAPQFSEALNTLGTIYYHAKEYAKSEEYFREALRRSPESFEPLVNLGGVLLSLDRPQEALSLNQRAVQARPHDALAQSQLGWSYLELGKFQEAGEHFLEAKRLDPAHFSRPQLGLAQVYVKLRQPAKAAEELNDFLRRHPDDPEAHKIRAELARLRMAVQ